MSTAKTIVLSISYRCLGQPDVVTKISCTKEDLDALVALLFERLNPRLAEVAFSAGYIVSINILLSAAQLQLGFRLVSITEEDTGREMIALVTEDVLPKEIITISGFTSVYHKTSYFAG